jgi:hypothetical protein
MPPAATWHASAVVVATGRYAEPLVPEWAARHRFGGRLLYAAEFRSGADLSDKRVLVVGLGNSGAEIAAELTEHAAAVAVSVRSTPPIARRQIAGIPLQALGIALAPAAPRTGRPCGRVAAETLGWRPQAVRVGGGRVGAVLGPPAAGDRRREARRLADELARRGQTPEPLR